jgi:hypothetical protein
MRTHQMTRTISFFALSSLTAFSLALAQDAQDQQPAPPPEAQQQQSPVPAPDGGWRRATDPAPDQVAQQPTFSNRPNYSAYPDYSQQGQGGGQSSDPNRPAGPPPMPPVPAQLTLKQGTYVTVRVNQPLSSDHNQAGDAFTATLVRHIVVDGVVVAQRGETIGGRVAEAQKAGRVEGVSRLVVQLTDLTLVDGQQLPIKSQLMTRNGPTSVGRDVAGVAGTTAVGAAIGAGVNGGVGAGVGAGAGLIVGTIGVLLTRGRPTVIYPESVLTFQIEQPVAISTDHAPYAFRYVDPNEYDRPYNAQGPQGPQGPPQFAGAGYGYAPPVAPYGYGYGAYGYPYYPYPYWGGIGYWGPGIYFGGRGFYGGGFYGGRGFGGGRGFRR